MELQSKTSEALDHWLGIETWQTNHECDLNRFFDFVNQYSLEHGFVMDEAALREEMERRVQRLHGYPGERAREELREWLSRAYTILDFLRHTGR